MCWYNTPCWQPDEDASDVKNDSLSHQKSVAFAHKAPLPEVVTAEGNHLFTFDPNTATAEQLQQLGLAPYQVRNIMKYRTKGGVYRSPMDFARVYGLTRKQYRTLEPYITIGDDYQPASTLASVQAYIAQKEANSRQPMPLTKLIRHKIRINPTKVTSVTRSVIL